MPAFAQINWKMHRIVRRVRLNTSPPVLGFAVVASLVIPLATSGGKESGRFHTGANGRMRCSSCCLQRWLSLGGADLPALGFGMGDVVLGELLRAKGLMRVTEPRADYWISGADDVPLERIMAEAARLRSEGTRSSSRCAHSP